MHIDPKILLRTLFFCILGAVIIAYAYIQSHSILAGPSITITTPRNGITVSQPEVLVEGIAKNISRISLDDRVIFVDEQGRFSEKLILGVGYNIIEVEAKDKFGKSAATTLELIYQ